MASGEVANTEMAAAWDGPEGDHWAEHADRYEASSADFEQALLARVEAEPGGSVLDVGCGAGASTVALARLVPDGEVLGIDLSARMLELGRRRAAAAGLDHVTFVQADAQVHPFDAGRFDVATSSFGAMFFGDPVAAYANIRRALGPGGRIAWVAWRDMAGNEWLSSFREALAAGRDLPSPPPGAPGPVALGDAGIGTERLEAAGFTDVAFEPVDGRMRFGLDAEEAWPFISTLGIVRGLTEQLDDEARAGALAALRRSLEEHTSADGVTYAAAVWCITATSAA
jgi:SAM-dependent methyltransferase